MRKQAEQLVVGRVYADVKEGKHLKPAFMRFQTMNRIGNPLFSYVDGDRLYITDSEINIEFSPSQAWYELTPEDEKELNLTPSEPTFTLSDIQRVIERIEREESNCRYPLIARGMHRALNIMREELKIK